MTRQHFSTKALLKIALEVESSHENSIKSSYFNLDKLNLIILRNDYIIDERASKVLWFRFERDMTIDEIVNELHSPAHIIRASLKDRSHEFIASVSSIDHLALETSTA